MSLCCLTCFVLYRDYIINICRVAVGLRTRQVERQSRLQHRTPFVHEPINSIWRTAGISGYLLVWPARWFRKLFVDESARSDNGNCVSWLESPERRPRSQPCSELWHLFVQFSGSVVRAVSRVDRHVAATVDQEIWTATNYRPAHRCFAVWQADSRAAGSVPLVDIGIWSALLK